MGQPASDSTVERLRRRAAGAQARVETMRGSSRVVDTLVNAYRRDTAVGGGVLSAAIGFRVFVFMVPYVWVIITLFGLAAHASGQSAQEVARRTGIEGLVAHAIVTSAESGSGVGIVTFCLGLVALVIAAWGVLKVLWIVHGLVWDVTTKRTRTPLRVAVLILTVSASSLLGALVAWLRDASFVVGVVATILFILVPTVMWFAVSWTLPHAEAPPWALAPGAAVFGLGVELLHVATIWWLPRVLADKSELYGTVGAAVALLVWAYLLGRLIVLSAIVNVAFNAHVAGRPVDVDALSARLRGISLPLRRTQRPPQQ